MTFRSFLFRMIKIEIQKYYLFLMSAIFSMVVFFVFANLWYTTGFQKNTNPQMHSLIYIAATITVIFSVFIISYVHWYMMKERTGSFSVLLSYGMTLKNLRRLIILETMLIYIVSLFLSFITGGVFSKLFFMISTKLLRIEQLTYELTYQSFLATSLVFALLFGGILLITLFKLSKTDIIALSKSKNEPDKKFNNSIFLGVLGIVLVVISLCTLYYNNANPTQHISRKIIASAVLTLMGTFLILRNFTGLIYAGIKTNAKKYYAHILEAAEFANSFQQNVKTLFVLTLLTIGIVLFTSVTYTLNQEAYHMTEAENPHDLYFEDFIGEKIINQQEADEYFSSLGVKDFNGMTVPFLYMEAPELIINNWRNSKWIPVISSTVYNKCFDRNLNVLKGSAVQIIFESGMDAFTYFDHETILLKNERIQFTLKKQITHYDKILNRYIFTQGMLLVVNDLDYATFEKEASQLEKGYVYIYMFHDWKNSKEICDKFSNVFYQKIDGVVKKNKDVYHELINRYGYAHLQVRSKADYFQSTKLQGSFSLFIMGFVSILFAFSILITYYFKVFLELSKDRERFLKLDGIGFLKKEKERLIQIRVALIMFVPSVLGGIIGIGWCVSLNLKRLIELELPDRILLKNACITGGFLLVVILLEYLVLTGAYIKRIQYPVRE